MKKSAYLITLCGILYICSLVQACKKNNSDALAKTFTDPRDGKSYETVKIGSQIWFAENINYETSNSWWYDNSKANGDVYGRLYTWEAALNACPSGWHLPTDAEWKTMETKLGLKQDEANAINWRETNLGKQLKSKSKWYKSGNGTNKSGFTALPGCYRSDKGTFYGLGYYGHWWTSTEFSNKLAWSRSLCYHSNRVRRDNNTKSSGRSVRCIKD